MLNDKNYLYLYKNSRGQDRDLKGISGGKINNKYKK